MAMYNMPVQHALAVYHTSELFFPFTPKCDNRYSKLLHVMLQSLIINYDKYSFFRFTQQTFTSLSHSIRVAGLLYLEIKFKQAYQGYITC